MAKDLGGFMKSFAGNLGSNLGGGGALGMLGGPMSGIGLIQKLMGGHGGGDDGSDQEQNPGQKMFAEKSGETQHGPQGGNGFLQKFGGSLSDQLFQRAMMGFMGR